MIIVSSSWKKKYIFDTTDHGMAKRVRKQNDGVKYIKKYVWMCNSSEIFVCKNNHTYLLY